MWRRFSEEERKTIWDMREAGLGREASGITHANTAFPAERRAVRPLGPGVTGQLDWSGSLKASGAGLDVFDGGEGRMESEALKALAVTSLGPAGDGTGAAPLSLAALQ
jgi:hypothetical protein